jgi:hypothetical protein
MDDTNESNRDEKILNVGQVREVDTALPITVMMRWGKWGEMGIGGNGDKSNY